MKRITKKHKESFRKHNIEEEKFEETFTLVSNLRKELLSDILEYEDYVIDKLIDNSKILELTLNEFLNFKSEFEVLIKLKSNFSSIAYFLKEKNITDYQAKSIQNIHNAINNVKVQLKKQYTFIDKEITSNEDTLNKFKNIVLFALKNYQDLSGNDLNRVINANSNKKLSEIIRKLSFSKKIELIALYTDDLLSTTFDELLKVSNISTKDSRSFIKSMFKLMKEIRNISAHQSIENFNEIVKEIENKFTKNDFLNKNNYIKHLNEQLTFLHNNNFKSRFKQKLRNNNKLKFSEIENSNDFYKNIKKIW